MNEFVKLNSGVAHEKPEFVKYFHIGYSTYDKVESLIRWMNKTDGFEVSNSFEVFFNREGDPGRFVVKMNRQRDDLNLYVSEDVVVILKPDGWFYVGSEEDFAKRYQIEKW